MDALTPSRSATAGGRASERGLGRLLIITVIAAVLLGLLGRILTYPLQHDEQFYLPPAILLGDHHLYRDIGFTHMPNLPLLLSIFYGLTDQYLLVGRLVVATSWVALLTILYRAARAQNAGMLAIVTAAALLLFNSNLLGEAGMAATNNFIPIPFAVGGLALFLAATSDSARAAPLAAASGLLLGMAAGFKANFAPFVIPVGLAAVLVPSAWPLWHRISRLALPMLAGGIVGALPTLIYLFSDPPGFLSHVFEAHRGPQIGYWLARPDLLDQKVMGFGAKLLLGRELWLGGTALLMLVLLSVLVLLLVEQTGGWRQAGRAAGWPVALVSAVIAVGALVSFLPTPAFPQYFTLPLPFGALLILLLYGRLDESRRKKSAPVFIASLALAAASGAPTLVGGLFGFVQPNQWASSKLNADSSRLAQAIATAGVSGPVATLEPLQALSSGLPIYPELALGPFIYRAADWIPTEQRSHYRYLASPRSITTRLQAHRPAAVVIGREGVLDAPLERFARQNGFRATNLESRSGGNPPMRTLFLAPAASNAP